MLIAWHQKNCGIKKNKAQISLEYSMLIVIIVASLLTMLIYIKRASVGRLKESVDNIGDQFSSQHTSYRATSTGDSWSYEGRRDKTDTIIFSQNKQKFAMETIAVGRFTGFDEDGCVVYDYGTKEGILE